MRKFLYIFLLGLITNLFAQNNGEVKRMLSFTVRGITPIGIFSENWKTGGVAYVSYSWIYSGVWSVRIQTGYNKYGLKSNSQYTNSPKLSMIPIQFGGRRYFIIGKVKPFVEAMSGLNIIRIFYKSKEVQIDERELHMNFQIGGGIAFHIIDNFELEVAALYNSHLINPSIPYNLTGFEYGVGVNWMLN